MEVRDCTQGFHTTNESAFIYEHFVFSFSLTSIGADRTLETVTTLPSKSRASSVSKLCLYSSAMHISTTG